MLWLDKIGVDVNIGPEQFIILKTTQDGAISESQINKCMIDGNFGNISVGVLFSKVMYNENCGNF